MMTKITYKSSIPNDKPLWLLKLQLSVSQLDATGLKGNEQDFRNHMIVQTYYIEA